MNIPLHLITKNIRHGFATNSSSSHSIIFTNGKHFSEKSYYHNEYEWEDFLLSSMVSKERYLKQTLYANIVQQLGMNTTKMFLEVLFPNETQHIDKLSQGSVDHQSLISLPKLASSYKENELDMDFFIDLKRFILSDNIIILGGNDNEFDKMDTSRYGDTLFANIPKDYKDMVSRYNGNYYMLFNKETGTKLRIQFDFTNKPVADSPELVDVKITDYCESGCKFCYQDSTRQGQHADLSFVKRLFDSFRPYTEIALGGGDIAKHPEIDRILKYGNTSNLIMNITVNDIDWIENPTILNAINEHVKGIGISVSQKRDFDKVVRLHEVLNKHIQFSIHYIPDLFPLDMFESLLEYVQEFSYEHMREISVLLLGYKTIGRGDHSKHQKIENLASQLFNMVKKFQVSVGVDTKFIQDYPEIKNFVDYRLYTENEGEFSMYVDAVKQSAHASSYEIENPINLSAIKRHELEKEIHSAFESFKK